MSRLIFRRNNKKSAQITVFMILGLLLLFVFIFVFSLSAGVKKGQLQEIQEKTLTKTFKKEALRIFVEDCLTDELETGLIIIGKQGRLWSYQPGGTRNFEEGISGVTVGNDRVFYGTIKDPYLEYENAYPCSDESSPEEFCQYSFPNTKIGFGSLELRTSTIQNDLRRYLLNRTVWCVAEFARENISSSAVLESQEINLDLGIHDSGIDVKVKYPLKLSLGNEEIFHLSEFDFFYPTRFKALLDTAVSFPLRMDWQYVDFNYTKEIIESPSFTYGNEVEVQGGNCLLSDNYFLCQQALFSEQYASLGVEMSRQPLLNGDDLFIFKSSSVLNTPELYTYQFARKNRPPALDYVHRMECPAAGYDFLVIKDDPELGKLNFTLSARDPDEDMYTYTVVSDDFIDGTGEIYEDVNVQERNTPYLISAYATDEHQLNDWQNVRVLVDRPLKLGISLNMAYKFMTSDGQEKDYGGNNGIFPIEETYLVSKEDPVFINIQFPEKSYLPNDFYKQQPILLHYENKDKTEVFDVSPSENFFCISLPGMKSMSCPQLSLQGYEEYINKWDDLLEPVSDPDQVDISHFRVAPTEGILNLSISGKYCALFEKSESTAVKIVVNDCVPHRNAEHPWAYPNHEYAYSSFNFKTQQGECKKDESGSCIKEEINPFEATHSCCIGAAENPNDWQIADADYPKPCFINPGVGCYGQVLRKDATPSADGHYSAKDYYTSSFEGYVPKKEGYVQEVQQQFCSGNRGNICDGEFKNELKDKKLICGTPGQNSCSPDINAKCANFPAFGFIKGEGWCHGNFGCSELCQKPVAYVGPITKEKVFDINALALEEEALDEKDISFSCGCTAAGQICDSNFDGKFNGVCQEDKNCAE